MSENNDNFTSNKKEIDILMNDIERLKKAKEKAEKDRIILDEISKKDILDLTEEEIVLLAQSRVHGSLSYTTSTGEKVYKMGTTFKYEYKKLTDLIEKRRNSQEDKNIIR